MKVIWNALLQKDWNAFFCRHADVIAGGLAWFVVGQFVGRRVSPEWGGVTLVLSVTAGLAAYLAAQKWYPGSRGST